MADSCIKTEEEAYAVVKVLKRICCENNIWYDLVETVKVRNNREETDRIVMSISVKICNR